MCPIDPRLKFLVSEKLEKYVEFAKELKKKKKKPEKLRTTDIPRISGNPEEHGKVIGKLDIRGLLR